MLLRVLATTLALALALAVSPAMGAGSPARPGVALTTFRLRVVGDPARDTTFWVAYGPLAGRFGIVRLRERSFGVYAATARLSTTGRTDITFVAGHGVIHTRAGPAPGNPVVTIRTLGPISIWPRGIPVVKWWAPVG